MESVPAKGKRMDKEQMAEGSKSPGQNQEGRDKARRRAEVRMHSSMAHRQELGVEPKMTGNRPLQQKSDMTRSCKRDSRRQKVIGRESFRVHRVMSRSGGAALLRTKEKGTGTKITVQS